MTAATTIATFQPTASFPVILRPILRTQRSGLPDYSASRPITPDIIEPVARDGIVLTTRRPAISWDMTAPGTVATEGYEVKGISARARPAPVHHDRAPCVQKAPQGAF
jgi:hypothetical protein